MNGTTKKYQLLWTQQSTCILHSHDWESSQSYWLECSVTATCLTTHISTVSVLYPIHPPSAVVPCEDGRKCTECILQHTLKNSAFCNVSQPPYMHLCNLADDFTSGFGSTGSGHSADGAETINTLWSYEEADVASPQPTAVLHQEML